MSTYVLVHGGWRGGWIYQRVANQLRGLGHVVYAPSLAGCGEHSHLLSGDICLGTHITDIVNLLKWEQLDEVILVGHSYGGMVITGVADQATERVKELVFLDAAVPSNGQSFVDLYPAERDAFASAAAANAGLYINPLPSSFFAVNEADQAWVDSLCTPFPHATLTEKLVLSGKDLSNLKRTYVLAEGWAANPYVDNRERLAENADWDFYSVAVGHDIMVDAPEVLVDILLRRT